MSIAEQVAAELVSQGWTQEGVDFRKSVETGGAFGKATATLTIDEAGRWLERVDGWGKVERDVDLRNFSNDAKGAIAAVMA